MPDEALVSYAQNGEDIVLWRALGHVRDGVYVDVGGWDPDVDSVTRLFYERGWRGVDVEPVPEFAERFRERRPLNDVVQAVVTDAPTERVVLHRFGTTGLSTVDDEVAERHDRAGLEREDIEVEARSLDDVLVRSPVVEQTVHFLKIDVEGAEAEVLRSVDLARWRPWVLVVEATEPNSTTTTHDRWEPILLAAGYTFTLFDGLSRFYVSADHPELAAALSYPACPLDEFQKAREVELAHTTSELEGQLVAARGELSHWREVADQAQTDSNRLRTQVAETRERLLKARGQRRELRTKVKRLRGKVRRLRSEAERLTDRVEQLEQLDRARAESVRGRLGAAARKALSH